MSDVRCLSCFRTESWEAGARASVTTEGGLRRPRLPAPRAAYLALQAHGAPVCACASCGQPMFSEDPSVPRLQTWSIPLPSGELVWAPTGAALSGAPIAPEAATAALLHAFPDPPPDPLWLRLSRTGLMAVIVIPITLWFFLMVLVVYWLSMFNVGPSGAFR